ncbi:MAG: lysylphosphatidylglycerol synthase transmembrane domain-containing protein [Ignavibacteriaceae bacterium]
MVIKNKIFLLLKFIISGALLVYLFTLIPFSKILLSIESADYFLVITGILLGISIQYFSAFETGYLTKVQGMPLSTFKILKIHLTTSFYSFFLPGTISGGAVKWYKFSKHGNKSAAAAVVLFNRFLEILITIFMALIFSFAIIFSAGNLKIFILLAFVFISMIVFYLLLMNKAGINLIEKTISHFHLPGLIINSVEKSVSAIRQFHNLSLKDHLEIIGLLFFYHGIGIISFFCLAKSLDINLNFWIISWVASTTSIATMFPIAFAGLGVREGTLIFLLGQFSIKPDAAFALSLLLLSRNIFVMLLGGLLELKENINSKEIEEGKSGTAVEDN